MGKTGPVKEKKEKAALKSEELFRKVYDTAPLAFVIWDLNTCVTDWNKKAEKVFGWSKEEVVGRNFFDFLIPEKDRPQVEDVVSALLQGDLPSHSINDNLTKDGRIVTCEWNNSPLHDKEGKILAVISLALDITAQKEAEKALRESEVLFRTVAEFTYDWEYWIGRDEKYIYISPSCERITGYGIDEFLQDPGLLEAITHPDDSAVISKHIHEELTRRQVQHIDFRVMTRGGEERWISHYCQPIFTPDGEYLGTRASNRDVTDRKRAEQALRESEERYRSIVNTAHEGIYVLDGEGRITFLNRQMAKMLGYRVEEMHGRNLADFIDDLTVVETFREESLGRNETKIPHDFRFLHKSNAEFWGMISSSPIYDNNGRSAGALGMVIDVTERKKAELALRRANNELKAFIDTVSHDLKNPIFSIGGFCNLLLRKYGDCLDDKGRGYLKVIHATADRMGHLVSDLLELSKIGKVVPTLASVDFGELVEKVVLNFKNRLEEAGVELLVAESFPVIYCDAERMYQVIENLLGNAIRFAKAAENPQIEVGYEKERDHHRFYVKDNGVGIEPGYHRRIFQLFERIPEKGNEEGTGLGLTIVEQLVRQHGGKVWVASEKGKGATFYFTLPE